MTGNECLRNYILQKIIKKPYVNKRTLDFIVDKTELTDQLLGELIDECAKYGLNDSAARSLITQTASNVNVSPSKIKALNNVGVENIPVGLHFKLVFNVKSLGEQHIELLCVEQNMFTVISSTVPGVIPFDIISSKQQQWNVSHDLLFKVTRDGKIFPDNDSELQIGTYQYMVYYLPTYIHKLFDSDEDFSHEGYVVKSRTRGVKYLDSDSVTSNDGRPVLIAKEGDEMERESLFEMTPNQDRDTATLELNVEYINSLIAQEQFEAIGSVLDCCDTEDGEEYSVADINSKTTIECIEPGVLQCSDLSSQNAYWFFTAKPIIKIY